MASSEQLVGGLPRKPQLLLVPSLSFARLPRVRTVRKLDPDSDAPSLPAVRCFRGTIRLLGAGEIDEEIAIVPRGPLAESGWSWDDDFTDGLPSKVSAVWRNCRQEGQYAHAVSPEELADVGVDRMVVWHPRQPSHK